MKSGKSVAFDFGFEIELRSGCHVGGHFDGKAQRQIFPLCDEEIVGALSHSDLREPAFIGDRLVRMQRDLRARDRLLTEFVDGLHLHQAFGTRDDPQAKSGGAFGVRTREILSGGFDAPLVEAYRGWGLQFDRRKIEATRAGPEFAGQRVYGNLSAFMIVDCKRLVRE